MLVYNVRSLLNDPQIIIPVEEKVEMSVLVDGADQYPILSSPALQGQIRNLDGQVLLFAGTLDYVLEIPCSRCNEAVEVPLHIELSQRYISAETSAQFTEADDCEVFSDYLLDLTNLVNDEMVLGIPMKVLCKEDCKGLCPTCGHNLNLGPCECKAEDSDSRWDALKALLKETNS